MIGKLDNSHNDSSAKAIKLRLGTLRFLLGLSYIDEIPKELGESFAEVSAILLSSRSINPNRTIIQTH